MDEVDQAPSEDVNEVDEAAQEKEWLRKTQEGDSDAFGNVVRLHQARLRGFAARFVESSDDVYDIVQDAFLSAYQHIDRFDIERDFGRWIRGICRNRIFKFFREQKSRTVGLSIIAEVLEERLFDSKDDDEEGTLERIEALRACIRKLDEPHRKLITMRYYYVMAVKDIGESLGKSAAAVSVQLMRVRGALRKCYERKIRTAQS